MLERERQIAKAAFLEEASHRTFMERQAIALESSSDLEVEEALWRQIAALEADGLKAAPRYTESIRARDQVLAYARLADLAEKQGSVQRASDLLARAAALCPQTGWAQCSSSSISAAARERQE